MSPCQLTDLEMSSTQRDLPILGVWKFRTFFLRSDTGEATQPVTKTKRKMRGARALPEPLEEPASCRLASGQRGTVATDPATLLSL